MGYYTRYSLYVTGDSDLLENFNVTCKDYALNYGNLEELLEGEWEPCKWYDWPNDMKRMSLAYPNLLFSLSGEGEESGDIWRAYARNGKLVEQKAVMTYAEIDLDAELPLDLSYADRLKAEKKAALEKKIAAMQEELEGL